ncbi:hypothetical protein NCCP2222_02320 [Sporosarcina sp. NCCP-2222]|nr:hypothetical protein NCCP2222_02320 [Sporosarcina sp. NCCP-2222]
MFSNEKGFTLIEMMIISNLQNYEWLNYSIGRGQLAVEPRRKSHKNHIYFWFRQIGGNTH